MDSIKHAIELAKAGEGGGRQAGAIRSDPSPSIAPPPEVCEVRLSPGHLERTRIVAHGIGTDHGHYYDMLRTQVLQEMDKNGWQFLGITSPTGACGKTVTACNLAMSIARLPERSVLLVDLDMRKPMIAGYLGLKGQQGILNVLEGRSTLPSNLIEAEIGPSRFLVLPGQVAGSSSAEQMASKSMESVLQSIKREHRSRIVLFDLPPMLIGDDVLTILPRMDAVLLVAGIGTSSVADIKECQRHLQRYNIVRVVVNKVTEIADNYYEYY